MTMLRRGMIIDVNLDPTQGAEKGKIRPCVIVTNNIYNERVPVIQVVPVTAWNEKKNRIKTNVEILPGKRNGLLKKSIEETKIIDIIDMAVEKGRSEGLETGIETGRLSNAR